VPWFFFRDRYLFAANRNVPGRPLQFSIRPRDKAIVTFPKSSAIYTISGEYFRRAAVFTDGTTEPIFPARFHKAVSWLGTMFYAAYEAAPETYAHAENQYGILLTQMEIDQLPEILIGGAMA
jgi:hypothetical protein